MRKVISLFFITVFFALPIQSVFASGNYDHNNGYIKNNPENIFKSTFRSGENIKSKESRTIEFGSPIDIDALYIDLATNQGVYVYFDGKLDVYYQRHMNGYHPKSLKKVKTITFTVGGVETSERVNKFEVFVESKIDHIPVKDMKGVIDYKSIDLSWTNPVGNTFVGTILKKDGKEVANLGPNINSYKFNSLTPQTESEFDIVAKYSDGGLSESTSIKLKTKEVPKITNLKSIPKHNKAELSWNNPINPEFGGVRILKKGVKVVDLAEDISTFNVDGLEAETDYTYEVTTLFAGGYQSDPVPVIFKTLSAPPVPLPAGDVGNLSAKPSHNRVDLDWKLPESNNFKHVNIYRETLKKSLFDKMFGINSVMAATPIFETNGTYFNDLTVESETKYEYTLTTTSTEKIESDGVSVIVTTLEDPTPVIDGGGYDKDPESGDYTYYWTEPTTGKVKVMVGGKLHATVEAVNGKIIIPAVSMKFTILGKPDVQLIPVDEEGNEGKPVKPPSGGGGGSDGGIDGLPFTESELMKGVFELLKLVGPYIVVALAFYLAPRFIEFIKKSIKQSKEGKKNVE